jgi:hypothetical protein
MESTDTVLPYLDWLEWAAKKGVFTDGDAKTQFGLEEAEFNHWILANDAIAIQAEAPQAAPVGVRHFRLKVQALFQYLEYVELQEARQSSLEARRLAVKAIWISIALGVISLGFGIWQGFRTSDVRVIERSTLATPQAVPMLSAPGSETR